MECQFQVLNGLETFRQNPKHLLDTCKGLKIPPACKICVRKILILKNDEFEIHPIHGII